MAVPIHPPHFRFLPAILRYAEKELAENPGLELALAYNNTGPERVPEAERWMRDAVGSAPGHPPLTALRVAADLPGEIARITEARNALLRRALEGAYDMLYFVDADVSPVFGALRRLRRYIEMNRGKVGVVGANVHLRWAGAKRKKLVEALSRRGDAAAFAVAPTKGERVRVPMRELARRVEHDPRYAARTYFMSIRRLDDEQADRQLEDARTSFAHVEAIGFGATLIDGAVVREIPRIPWPVPTDIGGEDLWYTREAQRRGWWVLLAKNIRGFHSLIDDAAKTVEMI